MAETSSSSARWRSEPAEVTDGLECEREPGQCRSEAVVEVATDASALLLAKLDDALSRQLQFLGETDCVDGGGDLGCEVGDQAVVALPEALAWARCEPELAERDPLMNKREREEVGARDAVFGGDRGFRVRPPSASASPTYGSARV